MKLIAIFLIGILLLSGCSNNVSKTTLGKQFCPEGYSDDATAFSWNQHCQGKPITCSFEAQTCFYIELSQEKVK